MSTLARQQQALVAALFDMPNQNAMKNIADYVVDARARGMKAYQSNGHALARRALAAGYPVLTRLLGEDSMAALACAYWHAHPPVCGDVAHWGAHLADFVAGSRHLQDTPYLPDVARLEWALHRMATLDDASPDLSTLARLGSEDPGALQLRLAPGTATFCSAWPLASMYAAHGENGPDFDEVGRLLRTGVAEDAVVWRQGFTPCVRAAMPGETVFLDALLAGRSVGVALDASPDLDISAWLTTAVQCGLLLAVVSGA